MPNTQKFKVILPLCDGCFLARLLLNRETIHKTRVIHQHENCLCFYSCISMGTHFAQKVTSRQVDTAL